VIRTVGDIGFSKNAVVHQFETCVPAAGRDLLGALCDVLCGLCGKIFFTAKVAKFNANDADGRRALCCLTAIRRNLNNAYIEMLLRAENRRVCYS
jgi:hypothetical protein